MIKLKPSFVLFFLIFINYCLSSNESLKYDRHFRKITKNFDVLAIELEEDVGEVLFDPVVKITLVDGKTFSISHAFSKNPEKLMLYKLDDYECSYTVAKKSDDDVVVSRPYGIGFNYLEKYFDFELKSIEDIIVNYDAIHNFIELLNTYFCYSLIDNGKGGKCRQYTFNDIHEYPGYKELEYEKIKLYVWDRNESRIKYGDLIEVKS